MNEPLITEVCARAVNVPLEFPIRTGSGTVSTSPLVLIDVVANDGSVGHAYVFSYTPLALGALRDLVRGLGDVIVGQPLAPQPVSDLLDRRLRLLGNTGLVRMATSGIDMALWDALARSHKQPLVRLLGGTPRELRAYDSHSMDGIELGRERAARSREHGFKAIKTKIGYTTLDEDLNVVRELRRTLGDGVSLMVDYNQSLSLTDAVERGRALSGEGVYWIEEPTLQQNYAGHAEIRARLDIPIQIGENWLGVDDMHKAIVAGSSDFVMPDVMKIGGVSGWLKATALAETYSLPMSSHIFQEISAHLLCVTPTAHWLEKMGIADAVLKHPLRFLEGRAVLSDEPGSGVEWNEEAVARYMF